MQKIVDRLKAEFEANPILFIAVSAALLTAGAKLMDANTQRSYAKTHAREVDRRIAVQSLK